MVKITTDRQVAALKPGEALYERRIDGVRGLIVRTFPSGTKAFEFRYVAMNGTRRRLPLGNYPGLTLAKASEEALILQVTVVKGGDPAADRAAAKKLARTGDTLADLAEAYFDASAIGLHGGKKRPKRSSTITVERSRFQKRIQPALGERRFADIKRADIKQFMRGLATSGECSADYVASVGRTLGSIFAFAVHEERLDANPVSGLSKPLETVPRERMFSEAALKSLWLALSKPIPDGMKRAPRKQDPDDTWVPAEPTVSLALRLALLTLTRRQDVAGAQWQEIDVKAKTWIIPSDRHKSRKAHVVPLSDTALALLRSAAALQFPEQTIESGLAGFIFPSRTLKNGHISEGALTKALSRTCANLGLPHGTPHDFRRTASTMLTGERTGIRRFIISKVLSHTAQEGAAVTEVYDRNDYLSEKRFALNAWERLLLDIVGEKQPTENVVPLKLANP